MAFVGRTSATRGALLKLRTNLDFIQNAMEILTTKRDRLATEMNKLLNELVRREKVEGQLMDIYADLKIALATLGYSTVSFTSLSISKMKVEVNPISVMGVVVPKVVIKEKSAIGSIENINLYELAKRQQALIGELLNVAQIEASVERIAHELMAVSRKVNALEKVIIPAYAKQIKYIEDSLYDEDLEDFARIKHIKVISDRRKT
jgi:V/A-type H+-transporting ATPase subunit D